MPIYEYACLHCGGHFEKLVQGHQAEVACPSCLSARVSRQISLVGVRTDARAAGAGSSMQGGGCCGGGCGCH
jgi:putative FmdB family regulatory protein